jgi:hypothetical protein
MADDSESLLWARRVSGAQYLSAWRIIEQAPPLLQDSLVARYCRIAGPERRIYDAGDGRVGDSFMDAFTDLRRIGHALREVRPTRAFDDDELEELADLAARHCMSEPSLQAAQAYALGQGVRLPTGPRVSAKGLRRRLISPDWWRRRLRTMLTRRAEELFRRLGEVRKQTSAYISGDALHRIRQAAFKSRLWLSEMAAVCEETGESLRLSDIAEHSLANPTLRRGELMLRARGFQEVAEVLGHRCLMVTATCPSAFHAWRSDGQPNPVYNGSTPREAQRWLSKQWARVRATLQRRRVTYYGIRASEPHHDGTPHWHLVIYAPASELFRVRIIMRKAWLSEYADEPGALKHRIRFTAENASKGSGAAYIAKYVAKNIDGAGDIGNERSDESGRLISDDAQRAVAWARLHGIRQFQQLRGPSVTLWRELRRVRQRCDCPPLEALRATTDETPEHAPSWSEFIGELGGIDHCLKRSRELFDKREPRRTDDAGRIVIKLTRWGELPTPIVVGLKLVYRDRIHRLPTHVFVWVLIFSPLGPVAITVRGPTYGSPFGWTNPQESSQAPPSS